jgi:hypothetical protein
MKAIHAIVTLLPQDYDAVLFDLDGVLTRTATVHAAAWKKLFDAFLQERSRETGGLFVPFDLTADYRRHVDGKPRYEGVLSCRSARSGTGLIGKPCGSANSRTDILFSS